MAILSAYVTLGNPMSTITGIGVLIALGGEDVGACPSSASGTSHCLQLGNARKVLQWGLGPAEASQCSSINKCIKAQMNSGLCF